MQAGKSTARSKEASVWRPPTDCGAHLCRVLAGQGLGTARRSGRRGEARTPPGSWVRGPAPHLRPASVTPRPPAGRGRGPTGRSAGRAGRESGPLRAALEEVPGPVAPVWASWSCGLGTVRGTVGRGRVRWPPRAGPMALVTVSRSPPASGHSTPVGPTVSLLRCEPAHAVGCQLGLGVGKLMLPTDGLPRSLGCAESGGFKAQAGGEWGDCRGRRSSTPWRAASLGREARSWAHPTRTGQALALTGPGGERAGVAGRELGSDALLGRAGPSHPAVLAGERRGPCPLLAPMGLLSSQDRPIKQRSRLQRR